MKLYKEDDFNLLSSLPANRFVLKPLNEETFEFRTNFKLPMNSKFGPWIIYLF